MQPSSDQMRKKRRKEHNGAEAVCLLASKISKSTRYPFRVSRSVTPVKLAGHAGHGRGGGLSTTPQGKAAAAAGRGKAAAASGIAAAAQCSLSFVCPLTNEIMQDPVVAADGYSYEKIAIIEWLQHSNLSPMTSDVLIPKVLIPNIALRQAIDIAREARKEEESTWEAAGVDAERQRVKRKGNTRVEEDDQPLLNMSAKEKQRKAARAVFLQEQGRLCFVCPITQYIMQEPVVAADGHTYEGSALMNWLQQSHFSPVTCLPLIPKILIPNLAVCNAICWVVQEPKTAQQHRNARVLRRRWMANGVQKELIREEQRKKDAAAAEYAEAEAFAVAVEERIREEQGKKKAAAA